MARKKCCKMYSSYNEGQSVVAERFIKIFKNKIYKYKISILKNVYINKFDGIVNMYNNTYHSTTKMKSVDVKQAHILTRVKKLMIKILNLKLVILIEYKNIKTFLQKAIFQIGLKKFLLLQKLKILFCGHMLLVILKVKKLLERFTKKN